MTPFSDHLPYFDRSGQPIDGDKFDQLKQDPNYRVVARSVVADADTDRGVVISTVWLGLDHGMPPLDDDHPPLIFETMVVDRAEWESGRFARGRVAMRYATEDEARTGHRRVVQVISADMGSPVVTDEVS